MKAQQWMAIALAASTLFSCTKEEQIAQEGFNEKFLIPTEIDPVEHTIGMVKESYGTTIWELDPANGQAISPAIIPSYLNGGQIRRLGNIEGVAISADGYVFVVGGETGARFLYQGVLGAPGQYTIATLDEMLQSVINLGSSNVIFQDIAHFGPKMTDVEIRTYTDNEFLTTFNANDPVPLLPLVFKEVFTLTEHHKITGMLIDNVNYQTAQQSTLFDLTSLYGPTDQYGPFKLAIKGNRLFVWDGINEDVHEFRIYSDGQNNPTLTYVNTKSINSISCGSSVSIQRTGFCIAGELNQSTKTFTSFDHLIHLKLNQCPGTETWNEINSTYTAYSQIGTSDKNLHDLSATNHVLR